MNPSCQAIVMRMERWQPAMGYPIDFEQSWQKKLGNALDRTAGQATTAVSI